MGLIWEVTQNSGAFLGGSVVKNSPANAGDVGSIPGLVRSPGEGHGNPLQCLCLENPMDRGAWRVGYDLVIEQQQQQTEGFR